MVSRRLVKTVSFPARSKPHMLRVSPDGKEVWVQTADANTNVVLGADDLSVLSTEPTGKSPVSTRSSPTAGIPSPRSSTRGRSKR